MASWPLTLEELSRARPVYQRFPGWTEELGDARTADDVCSPAAEDVDALEQLAGVPISILSVGPERTQTMSRGTDGRSPAALTSAVAG